ncbi:MAG: flagellar hook-associated protein FlgL, partial [Gallionella sp.]
MRVSSNTIFDSNVAALGQQQARLLQTQQQIASGKRLLTAASDPVAATRALDITQADAIITQQTLNRGAARDPIAIAESTLQSVTTLIQDVRTAAVYAGNSTLTPQDRATLATDMSGRLQELIGLANNTDGTGNYLFSGFQSKTPPFSDSPAGVIYNGDDGKRLMQVSSGRQIAANDSGADVFMRIKNGNGTFATQATATNTGTGVVSQGA